MAFPAEPTVMYRDIVSHRTPVVLTDDLYDTLKHESKRTGASLAELVRRAIVATYPAVEEGRAEEILRSTFGAWRERNIDGAAYVEGLRKGMAHRLDR